MRIDVSDLNRLAVDLGRNAGQLGVKAAAAIRKTAFDIEREAKSFAPVDTGNLRNSISTDITNDGRFASMTAEIGPTAEYGAFVEYGTSRMAPAAYMGPAADRNFPSLEAAFAAIAEEILQ